MHGAVMVREFFQVVRVRVLLAVHLDVRVVFVDEDPDLAGAEGFPPKGRKKSSIVCCSLLIFRYMKLPP